MSMGIGPASGVDTPFGQVPGLGTFILTQVDASSLGAVGVSAPICHVDVSTSSSSLLRLGGSTINDTLFWEAHWSGEQQLPAGANLSVHNGNPASGTDIDVALSGVWYP